MRTQLGGVVADRGGAGDTPCLWAVVPKGR